MDRRGASAHRRELVETASGVVLEIGAGYGATFAHYPDAVTRVLAVEPDPALRDTARAAAREVRTVIDVVDGDAARLPVEDGTVDVVVSSLVLCSVSEQPEVLAELTRVLRPGGRLLFYEHVRSSHRMRARLEDLITPAWARVAGGCHPNRDTATAVAAAGFDVIRQRRFAFSIFPGIPAVDHVIAVARKPLSPSDSESSVSVESDSPQVRTPRRGLRLSRRALIGIAAAVVVGVVWAVATGSVPGAAAAGGSPQTWWGILTGVLGSALIGALVASYVDAPIGAYATWCDTRWPVLGLLGMYGANDVRSVMPVLTGWSRPAVAVAALALLTWALVERRRLEASATNSETAEGEVCTTCRPLFVPR